jgi:hypothetical protein
MKFSELIGKTFTNIKVSKDTEEDEILFTDSEGIQYRMYHHQDCCESVWLDDVCGDMDDLLNSPITYAEEATSGEGSTLENKYVFLAQLEGRNIAPSDASHTWTFYKLDTAKGGVTLRWIGESNGYYSESVDFWVI